MATKAAWMRDADNAKRDDYAGKVHLSMLIARSVVLSERGKNVNTDISPDGKVSAGAFAERSTVSINTIKRHLKAWALLADDGKVPASDTLKAGDETDALKAALKALTTATYDEYYKQAGKPAPKTPATPNGTASDSDDEDNDDGGTDDGPGVNWSRVAHEAIKERDFLKVAVARFREIAESLPEEHRRKFIEASLIPRPRTAKGSAPAPKRPAGKPTARKDAPTTLAA